ncbi:MAG: hypothetical protein JWN70_5254 [Planctomycetaceae bacterium]|nr:hypothetical protein [Planctomycetaceae bacterium]
MVLTGAIVKRGHDDQHSQMNGVNQCPSGIFRSVLQCQAQGYCAPVVLYRNWLCTLISESVETLTPRERIDNEH